jgi:PIN domain nuclease of toxin-antitoxin system
VKLLLDTHAFLWAITDDPKLSEKARRMFTSNDNELLLSVASVWEILVKVQIGKLPLPKPAADYLRQQLTKNAVVILPIQLRHALRLEQLPPHHRDPFDRILIAQSLEEELPILTADPLMKNYSATIMW